GTPTAIAKRIDSTPACIETRAPQMTRESVSRPRSSVPNGCAQLGALRIALQLVAFGSAGASQGAASATITKASTTSRPPTAGGRRARRRQATRTRSPRIAPARGPAASTAVAGALSGLIAATLHPDARVEEGVGHIHEEVQQHVGARGDEDHALDDRIVAGED